MVTIPELKLNKCDQVSIPKPAELFARFGYTKPKSGNMMSGDENIQTGLSKVEQASQVAKFALDDAD